MRARTPMMQQYFAAKEAHPGVLMAMRVGDFYEFYGEDAEIAAAALQITLTGRDDAENGRISMAGVPYHSVEKYLAKLIQQGLKVALCDQVEDPKTAKGLVRRAVTRVLTPGTVVEDSMLTAGSNNYLTALCLHGDRIGLATLDTSTGEFLVTELENGEKLHDQILAELARLRPAELLVAQGLSEWTEAAQTAMGIAVTEQEPPDSRRAQGRLKDQFRTANFQGFGLEEKPGAQVAAAMVLSYAEANGLGLAHIESISSYSVDGFIALDPSTRRSLELTANLMDGGRRFTLLEVLDETVTVMGSRLLKRWIEMPLLDGNEISRRHGAIEKLVPANLHRQDLRDALRKLSDLERLVGRCATGIAGPRDLAALRSTLNALPGLNNPLSQLAEGRLAELQAKLGHHRELAELLKSAIVSDPPHALRDGGVVAEGYDAELDKLRAIGKDGRSYIAELEREEREKTGISSLKVGYNSVFGYYLEVGKAHQEKVPANYVRKQTTANAERYITAELKEQESAVLGASEKALALESEIFGRIRTRVTEHAAALLQTAKAISELDVLAGLAEVAVKREYRKPELVSEDMMEIAGGRHPVVEANTPQYVPNDTSFTDPTRLMVITGPNMSGKSTYLRQTAVIALMAQIGSYVPAKKCRMSLCDRIFARIGAKDEIALGQSTFMVEMVESAYILNHASPSSLVILDEVGRGTSTFDGLAIAWAMMERLAEIGCKTMFATHYHQLNVLADSIPSVVNLRVSVKEVGDDIVWTHKVLPGGTDKSYGIHVARKAGVPRSVLERAGEILSGLENADRPAVPHAKTQSLQLTLFEAEDPWIVQELKSLDVNAVTPLEALMLLGSWKERSEKR